MKTLPAVLVLVLLAAALAGCASSKEPLPAGIGSGPDQLKRSPCACSEIPQRGIPLAGTRI